MVCSCYDGSTLAKVGRILSETEVEKLSGPHTRYLTYPIMSDYILVIAFMNRAPAYPQMAGGLVVVIVDDEDDIRLMVERFLQR